MDNTFTGRSSCVVGISTGTLKYGQKEFECEDKQTQIFLGYGYAIDPNISLMAGITFGPSPLNANRIAAYPGIGVSINTDILSKLFNG